MNFNSQICTTKEQSKRLIALGLEKATADMYYFWVGGNEYRLKVDVDNNPLKYNMDKTYIPAWSLHRLIEMTETRLRFWPSGMVEDNELEEYYDKGNYFDNIIDLIARIIEDRYFNGEYLNK